MNAKHTPGPWVAKYTSGAGLGVWADLRPALGDRYSKDFEIIGSDALPAPRVQIAYEAWVQFPTAEWKDMQAANMRLAAVAPDLLEALQALCETQTPGAWRWAKARAAIAKATGAPA